MAATYSVVTAAARGKAHGSVLMGLLEREAERLGYHYVYLWTQSAVGFYRRLGYMMCEKVCLCLASARGRAGVREGVNFAQHVARLLCPRL